jgi:hypothetical protein
VGRFTEPQCVCQFLDFLLAYLSLRDGLPKVDRMD